MARQKATTDKEVTIEKVYKPCSSCGTSKVLDQFYASTNPMDSHGRVSICKTCVIKKVDINRIETVKDMLLQLNKPFLQHQWDSAVAEGEKRNKNPWGMYIKSVYFNYREWTWKDSDSDTSIHNSSKNADKDRSTVVTIKSDFHLTEEIIDKWGEGYTPEHYRLFEKKYSKLVKNYGEKTELHTEGLLVYIRFRVQEEMASSRGDAKEAKDWAALASKAAQDAKINVSQLSKSDISGGVDVLAQLFEAVETEASIIPLLPKVLEQPYDDADMIIWSNINYYRELEGKPRVPYRDIWNFYDTMLGEYYEQKGFNEEQIIESKQKRNNVFRDLGEVYIEPLYDDDGDE